MARAPARRGDTLPSDYLDFLAEVKARIASARTQAMLAVNTALIQMYWEIGTDILSREERAGWGAKVIDRLSDDLRREFPDMTGLSRSNLKYMRAFAAAWPFEGGSGEIGQQPVGQLPWGQNIVLLTKLDDREARLWYANMAVKQQWSRKILEAQIASDLRGRQGSALTSFEGALPKADSELVRDAIKDPYNFEFLNLAADAKERDLELALLNDVEKFLMEMGRGFALVGRQYPLTVLDEESGEEKDYFLDLLFYNYILRRFVVIDLKIEEFKPDFAGKMNFYLNAVDELERQPEDEPSIGLILCPPETRPSRSGPCAEWQRRWQWRDTPLAMSPSPLRRQRR